MRNAILWAVIAALAAACSPTRRPASDDDAGGDSGADTDLPWDTGTDTDVLVVEPVLLFPEPEIDNHAFYVAAAFDGSHVGVSWSNEDLVEPYNDRTFSTMFLAFPWEWPDAVACGSFEQLEPTSDPGYGWTWGDSNSVPHAVPGGFLVLTSTIGWLGTTWDQLDVVETLWDNSASLLDGPSEFDGLFPYNAHELTMNPFGVVGADGAVITGELKGENLDIDTDTESGAVLDVDRWTGDGSHERLAHELFPWPELPDEGNDYLVSSHLGQNLYLRDGVYTLFSTAWQGVSLNETQTYDLVVTRFAADGEVVAEPTPTAIEPPPVPAEYAGYHRSAWYALAASNDAVLVVAKVNYYDPTLEEGYYLTEENPIWVGLWSMRIDFDGTPLGDWVRLVDFQSNIEANQVRAAWSGRYFAVCYHDPFDTQKMIAMDDQGVPAAPPIDLFWPIPIAPYENHNQPCDLVAIDENTFVIVFSAQAEPSQAYADGLWATRVDINLPAD